MPSSGVDMGSAEKGPVRGSQGQITHTASEVTCFHLSKPSRIYHHLSGLYKLGEGKIKMRAERIQQP